MTIERGKNHRTIGYLARQEAGVLIGITSVALMFIVGLQSVIPVGDVGNMFLTPIASVRSTLAADTQATLANVFGIFLLLWPLASIALNGFRSYFVQSDQPMFHNSSRLQTALGWLIIFASLTFECAWLEPNFSIFVAILLSAIATIIVFVFWRLGRVFSEVLIAILSMEPASERE